MAITTLPDLRGTRISQVRDKADSPGTIELLCDRPLGISEGVHLGFMPTLQKLGQLVGTNIGEAALELAVGDTARDVHLADIKVGNKTVGCVTLELPRNTKAALANLLDDILRLAQLPASQTNPQDTRLVQGEIKQGFNAYLAALEEDSLTWAKVGSRLVSALDKRSMLWTYFGTCLTRHGGVTLTTELLVRFFQRAVPWMGDLLEYLAQNDLITGGDIATTVENNGMRLFSLPASPNRTSLDCLEAIVAAAETFAGYKPTEPDIVTVSRETRWHEGQPAISDPLMRTCWRWSLVLRELERKNAG